MTGGEAGHSDFFNLLAGVQEELAEFRAALTEHVRSELADHDENNEDVEQQNISHGLAWYGTLLQAFHETCAWLQETRDKGQLGASGIMAAQILVAELLGECRGGVVMHQLETFRPEDFRLKPEVTGRLWSARINALVRWGSGAETRRRFLEVLMQGQRSALHGLELQSEALAICQEIGKFAAVEITPYAQTWHMDNLYVPDETISALGRLGVFGVSAPEAFGGSAAGKIVMCAMTEELSRAYLGAGSLGTRAEIAAELIIKSGRPDQQVRYLPGIAAGEIITAAAFTEPEAGSDLGAVRCRAIRDGDDYIVNGTKVWITHAARADLMTLLVRTDPGQPGYRGLSMLLVEKRRGEDGNPFPDVGMSGSEIEVIGYRGMKEYEIGFDNFRVPASALLGDEEGQGFRQLMQTFETARIQTAARAVGVARAAMDHALDHACQRRQFGKPLIAFARVANKIVRMYVEILAARLLTFAAARAKDAGRRCDLEAGMAKLYAARAAWAAADGAVQIHGGGGFAVASPISRLLCDARVLSIFEGAAEIQAQIIARRLLQR